MDKPQELSKALIVVSLRTIFCFKADFMCLDDAYYNKQDTYYII
jgi:hypothetical protein